MEILEQAKFPAYSLQAAIQPLGMLMNIEADGSKEILSEIRVGIPLVRVKRRKVRRNETGNKGRCFLELMMQLHLHCVRSKKHKTT